jgi:hydroxymethylbilane synthase
MLRIGSRGSKLALWQANWVKQQFEERGTFCSLEVIKTTGDKITSVLLAKVGTKGLFTKEIEEALLDGRIDLAVHSLKDLPTELPPGLKIAAIPEREDARDALVGRRLADLPAGSKVGTSSLRRVAQLCAARSGLVIESVRGNLDTRLRKLSQGEYDALVLATAGLRRLGWADRIAEYFPVELMCPAPGQGALAIETREDGDAARACAALDHAPTRAAVEAERAVLAALGGGCQVPIGVYGRVEDGRLELVAFVGLPDGSRAIRLSASGRASDGLRIGTDLGRELLEAGAREILLEGGLQLARSLSPAASPVSDKTQMSALPLAGQRIVVTRAQPQAGELSAKLLAFGAEVVEFPVIEICPARDYAPLDAAIARIASYDWLIFTSANGVRFFLERLAKAEANIGDVRGSVCAIGPATRLAAENAGLRVALMPPEYVAESLVRAFEGQDLSGKRILLPRAAVARDVVPDELARRGAQVDVIEAYRTAIPRRAPLLARKIFAAGAKPDWITFTSSSTVNNFVAAAGREALDGVRVASIGPVTTATARGHGIEVTVEASRFTTDGLVEAITGYCATAR